ncbi:MAG: hypothetical protein K2J60_06220 [Acetatifactor sp.]|nr:hypothetical protein [Acetatifactor sp.]
MAKTQDAYRETWNAARRAVESTYEGVATVTVHKKETDGRTGLANWIDAVVLDDQPCRVSFSSISAVTQTESAAAVGQTVKLFISPDICIKPGSKITVTQSGVTTDYTYSGVPAVYATHQEIMLDLFKEWS